MSSLLQQTWQTLMAHRMKSVLAIIAIAWGVISVVVLIALGEGFYRHQTQSFSFMVNNVQVVFPSSTSKPWQGLASRRQIDIPQEKVDMIKQSGSCNRRQAFTPNGMRISPISKDRTYRVRSAVLIRLTFL